MPGYIYHKGVTTNSPTYSGTGFVISLLSTLLLPVWLVHTLILSARGGGRRYFRERFGFYDQKPQSVESNVLWIHCASVGEVRTVLPLLEQLQQQLHSSHFVVTTNTPTGWQVLQQAQIDGASHVYLPVDHGFAIRRFLHQVRPQTGLIVETEIWPSLYHECRRSGVPVVLINGRLSAKTERVTRGLASFFIAPLLANALASVTAIIARSQDDISRFRNLIGFGRQRRDSKQSADGPTFINGGNLKNLSLSHSTSHVPIIAQPYCLLASTHDDEELQLSNAWFKKQRQELLVIVPRHPQRADQLQKLLMARGLQVILRSAEGKVDNITVQNPTSTVYIADTLGELPRFYGHSNSVFIGGSLAPIGGHNLFEAARLECAIVTGPHLHNFEIESQALLQNEAMLKMNTADEVVDALCRLLDNAEKAATLAAAGKSVADAENDVSQRYLNYLLPLLRANVTR